MGRRCQAEGSEALEGKMRFRSVRSYRESLNRMIRAAWAGEIPWTDVQRGASAMRVASEMFMAENLMKLQGLEDVEAPGHPIRANGGLGRYVPPKTHVTKRITRKRGVNAKGMLVDEDAVQEEGGAADVDGLEVIED